MDGLGMTKKHKQTKTTTTKTTKAKDKQDSWQTCITKSTVEMALDTDNTEVELQLKLDMTRTNEFQHHLFF